MNQWRSYLEKLPRRSIYVLGLVAVVFVGSVYLMSMTVQDASAKLSTEKQLNSLNITLQQTAQANNLDSVQAELVAVQSQLKEWSFPEQPPSVELVALLVKSAREAGVEMGNLQVTAMEQEKIGGTNYNVMRQRVQFRGTPTQLAGFISRMEKGGFKSLVLDNLSLSPRGSAWEARVDMYLYSTR